MRSYLFSIWLWIDPIYYRLSRLTYLREKENIFRVRLTRYKGEKVTLSCGATIDKNDLLVKIHLHNVRILKLLKNTESEIIRARQIYRMIERSLPGLAEYIAGHKQSQNIKGIIGITSLHRGAARLGFEPKKIESRWYRIFKQLALLPICLIAIDDWSTKIIHKHVPEYLFMSKHTLYKRHRRKLK